jgi:hypothetical protein
MNVGLGFMGMKSCRNFNVSVSLGYSQILAREATNHSFDRIWNGKALVM